MTIHTRAARVSWARPGTDPRQEAGWTDLTDYLTLEQPPGRDRSLTFGKGPGCDVAIADEYASAIHCRITQHADGRHTIEDLGSTNGTWIQRGTILFRVTSPQPLLPGDIVQIGRTRLPWQVTK